MPERPPKDRKRPMDNSTLFILMMGIPMVGFGGALLIATYIQHQRVCIETEQRLVPIYEGRKGPIVGYVSRPVCINWRYGK